MMAGMDLYPAIDLRGGRCVRLYQGDFAQETDNGEKRSKVEVVADEIAPSLRWATAQVQKIERRDGASGGGGGGYSGGGGNAPRPAASNEPTNYDGEEPF